MLRKLDFAGNPYLGVFCAANNSVIVASPHIPTKALRMAEDSLGVAIVRTTLGGSTVVGSLIAMNSRGALVTRFAEGDEVSQLREVDVYRLNHRLNAVGNNVLVNDRGGLCHPDYGREVIREMEDVFGVPVERATLGGMKTVGSAAVVNNRGAICHPHSREQELRLVQEMMKVVPMIATANYGTPQLGACVVANDSGALIGNTTTPIEVGRIEEGLHLY